VNHELESPRVHAGEYVKSVGDKYSGKDITKIRDHYSNLRAKLQHKAKRAFGGNLPPETSRAKGKRVCGQILCPQISCTRSSRRRCRQLQKRLSGALRRFQSHINHTIIYQLVQKARTNNQVIALEDLTGIVQRTNELPRTKVERRRSNSWGFYQLRQFLTYKCIKFGVKLVLVNPAYTSKTCHNCLHIHPKQGKSYRSGKSFRCGNCSWSGDADLNRAINISVLGQLINLPRGSGLACSLEHHVLELLKTPCSA
jgi:IS605 OrfB family transposase